MLDAGRLRAGQRVAADEARVVDLRRTSSRLVEPTSVTTHAGAAAASASRTAPGSARTGAATKAAVAPASASAGDPHAALIAPCSSALSSTPGAGS